jgi:hypothetical protein
MATIDLLKRSVDGDEREYDMSQAPLYGEIAATFTGIWAADQAATIKWTVLGQIVGLTFTIISQPATIADSISLVGFLPSYLRPLSFVHNSMAVIDNDVGKMGKIIVKTGGGIQIFADPDSGNFSGTGDSGFFADPVFYLK